MGLVLCETSDDMCETVERHGSELGLYVLNSLHTEHLQYACLPQTWLLNTVLYNYKNISTGGKLCQNHNAVSQITAVAASTAPAPNMIRSPIHKHCRKTCHKVIITHYLRCHKIILRHVVNEFTEFIFNNRNFFHMASCCHGNYGRLPAVD